MSKPSYPELYCPILSCTVLYCTVLYYTVMSYPVLSCPELFCTVVSYPVLYYTVLYCTILYYTILYCSVLHCPRVIPFWSLFFSMILVCKGYIENYSLSLIFSVTRSLLLLSDSALSERGLLFGKALNEFLHTDELPATSRGYGQSMFSTYSC